MNSKRSPWSRIRPKTTNIAIALLAGAWVLLGAAAADAAPWLFVSDIHLKATHEHSPPSTFGDDTDRALFESALREMKRVDPHPPVVVVGGDLLDHHITRKASTPTSILIAKRLNAAFPEAQFVLALGNEDSACGDYALAPDSHYLRDLANAWGPMINRHGAAPNFMRTFAHDGFYTAKLPVPGLQAIVINDVYWSPRYHAGCGPANNIGYRAFDEFDAALARATGRVWVVMHIPPGVDAYSTAQLSHRTVIVPFMQPDMRDRLVSVLGRKPGQVALAIAGHTHKFAFRIVKSTGPEPVPMLLIPGMSPIFDNGSAFLTADVTSDGSPRDIQAYSFIDNRWSNIGGLRSLGVDAFTGKQLERLHGRLDRDAALRAKFARLYNTDGRVEITERTWPVYSCAATSFSTAAFRTCDDAGGISFITERGVKLALVAVVAFVVFAGAIVWWFMRRRRLRT